MLEALRARRRRLVRLRIRPGLHHPELETLRAAARDARVPIEPLEPAGAGPEASRGVVLEAGPLPEAPLEELVQDRGGPRTLVALDGVEDPQNLGAIARVAEASGAAGLVLTRRRAPPLSPAVARSSAGAIEWLPVARVANLPRALNALKTEGFWIFGCDAEEGRDLFGLPERILGGDGVLVFGAEGRGLRPAVERTLDHRVRIPMAGRVASLNVSAAAAVVLFELARRREFGVAQLVEQLICNQQVKGSSPLASSRELGALALELVSDCGGEQRLANRAATVRAGATSRPAVLRTSGDDPGEPWGIKRDQRRGGSRAAELAARRPG